MSIRHQPSPKDERIAAAANFDAVECALMSLPLADVLAVLSRSDTETVRPPACDDVDPECETVWVA